MEKINIKISNYSVTYKSKKILDSTNFSFNANRVYLLDGPNGSGKSTFIKSLIGLERNTKIETGEIKILENKNTLEMNHHELQYLRSKIAYLEQKDYYDQFKFVDVLDILKDSYSDYLGRDLNTNDIRYIIEIFNMYISKNEFTLKTKVNKLSGGQQRMLSIISSICIRKDSPIFILDEPLNNLDINNVIKVSNMINNVIRSKHDSTFIIISHYKIFPFITDLLKIENNKIVPINDEIKFFKGFGQVNAEGFYI